AARSCCRVVVAVVVIFWFGSGHGVGVVIGVGVVAPVAAAVAVAAAVLFVVVAVVVPMWLLFFCLFSSSKCLLYIPVVLYRHPRHYLHLHHLDLHLHLVFAVFDLLMRIYLQQAVVLGD
ncbi:unnamed protein product, partial [Pylaiella littoralis]